MNYNVSVYQRTLAAVPKLTSLGSSNCSTLSGQLHTFPWDVCIQFLYQYMHIPGSRGSIKPPFCDSLSLMWGPRVAKFKWFEDLVSVSVIIPSVTFHYCHSIFTGGCDSSKIQSTVANPLANQPSSVNAWLHACSNSTTSYPLDDNNHCHQHTNFVYFSEQKWYRQFTRLFSLHVSIYTINNNTLCENEECTRPYNCYYLVTFLTTL